MLSNSTKSLRVVVGGIWRSFHIAGLYFTFHGWLAQGLQKKGTRTILNKTKYIKLKV